MSDWQVGDLAVCVDDGPCKCCAALATYVAGRIYSVLGVHEGCNHPTGYRGIYLDLGLPPRVGHRPGASARRFRKVDKHEACETEFVTLLKRSKRNVTIPVSQLIVKLIEDQEQRHAWLFGAGEQIREWREEDRRAGIIWSDEHGN